MLVFASDHPDPLFCSHWWGGTPITASGKTVCDMSVWALRGAEGCSCGDHTPFSAVLFLLGVSSEQSF